LSCAAFFSEGKVAQTMREHVEQGLDYIRRVFLERGYADYVHMIALRARLSASAEQAEQALLTAYTLHDAGKLLLEFQDARGGFQGHEFASAALILKSCESLGGLQEAAALAVLLHHHTMPRKPRALLQNRSGLRFAEECIAELEELLERGTGLPVRLARALSVREVEEVRSLLDLKAGDWPRLRLVFALLEPLMLADNYASRSRGGEPTLLGNEAEKLKVALEKIRLSFREGVYRAGESR